MTCKDCIHEELCSPNSVAYGFKLKPCSKFKNKADFVEVVRCKDCKHMRRTMSRCYCLPTFGLKQITDLNAFCSYGERK